MSPRADLVAPQQPETHSNFAPMARPAPSDAAEFIEVAKLLGHDPSRIRTHGEHCSQLRIPSLEQARRILSRASDDTRRDRSRTFYQGIAARQKLFQGMHDRGEEYVWADGRLHAADRQALEHHLPLRVKTLSITEKRVRRNTLWDIGTRADDWDAPIGEELYCILNIGTLIIEEGAALVVRGNVFTLVCQRLVILGDASPIGDIAILGTPHHATGVGGQDGAAGAPGADAPTPPSAAVYSSILGPLTGPPTTSADTTAPRRQAGSPGREGARGSRGLNGGPAKLAELNIREIAGIRRPVLIVAQAGPGMDGGAGGPGGAGGAGSASLPAYRHLNRCDRPIDAGDGGNGGPGGPGGAGGCGGISSNIYIEVPATSEADICCRSLASRGGKGGAGGPGGIGGRSGPCTAPDARTGKPGLDGKPGALGLPGRPRPGPLMFVNSVLRAG